MGWQKFLQYLKAIDALEAGEDLRRCTVAAMANPNLKKEARQNTIRELKKRTKAHQEIAPTPFAEVAKKLAQGLKHGR